MEVIASFLKYLHICSTGLADFVVHWTMSNPMSQMNILLLIKVDYFEVS